MTNAMKTAESSASSVTFTRSPLLPHAAFWAVGLLAKLIFPASLKWLAYDSITTLLLSVWYPLCATVSLIHREKAQLQRQSDTSMSSFNEVSDSLQIERQFWIEYWSVGFAGVQFLHHFIALIPSLQQMGRYDYPQLPIILSEIKLLFFVWVFVMETLLARYQRHLGVDERKENWKKFVPLTFLTKAIGPRLMRVQLAISEQISKDTWQRVIQRKAQRVLELMVVLQFLEEESMTYLLQLLEEGRSLLLLSVFMVLPSSISQLGMLYAQFIFPSARSLVARGNAMEIMSLKYWVLNSVLSLLLTAGWWLLWCFPFSNQLILGMRCFATFPSTITHYYAMVEMELITFGILSGEPKLTVRETRTVQALRAVVKRLPRDKHAQSFQFELDEQPSSDCSKESDDDSSIGSVDTTDSEVERRRQRRREKRAKKRLLKEKKLSESRSSTNGSAPPALLSESFVAQYDEAKDEFVSAREDEYGVWVNEKEQRDARNAATSASQAEIRHSHSLSDRGSADSMTIGSNYSSSQMQSASLSIGTPTESVIDEVEVQVKATTRRSMSTRSRNDATSFFPATHPKSSGTTNLAMPSASSEEVIDLTNSTMSSIASSTIDEVHSKNSAKPVKNEFVDSDEVIEAPRRSSRLTQLREWQERKRLEEESSEVKSSSDKNSKSKTSKTKKEKPRPEVATEKVAKKSSKSKSSTETSPKKASKKSKQTSPDGKSKEASPSKKSKKKSSAASPEKTTKSSKKKGEAPVQDGTEGETPRSKPKKIPNSKKKKKGFF